MEKNYENKRRLKIKRIPSDRKAFTFFWRKICCWLIHSRRERSSVEVSTIDTSKILRHQNRMLFTCTNVRSAQNPTISWNKQPKLSCDWLLTSHWSLSFNWNTTIYKFAFGSASGHTCLILEFMFNQSEHNKKTHGDFQLFKSWQVCTSGNLSQMSEINTLNPLSIQNLLTPFPISTLQYCIHLNPRARD